MLDRQDNLAQASTPTSTHTQKMRQTSIFAQPNTDSLSQAEINETAKGSHKNRIELEWKKEIKHYFKALRNYRTSPQTDKEEAWLSIALRLLDLGRNFENREEIPSQPKTQKQRKDVVSSKIMTIITEPPKNYEFLILILSYRISQGKKQQIYFDLQLIIKSSRIIYKKINLKYWQEIHSEVQRAKTLTKNVVLLLQGKSSLKLLFQRNLQMQNLIDGFSEMDKHIAQLPLQSIQMNGVKIQENPSHHIISSVVEKFHFIRESLIHGLKASLYHTLTLNQVLALTLIHNVITLLPLATTNHLFPQIKTFCNAISRHLRREYDRHQSRNKSVALNQNHFPVHLQNAQNCWRCKMKRGYICCSTCSRTEGKNISLCLNCYEKHHQELNKNVGKTLIERQAAAIFDEWSSLDDRLRCQIEETIFPVMVKVEQKNI